MADAIAPLMTPSAAAYAGELGAFVRKTTTVLGCPGEASAWANQSEFEAEQACDV
jgi:hypothetical protein